MPDKTSQLDINYEIVSYPQFEEKIQKELLQYLVDRVHTRFLFDYGQLSEKRLQALYKIDLINKWLETVAMNEFRLDLLSFFKKR